MSRYIDAEPLDKEISSWITDDRGGNLDNDEIVFNETLVDCLEAISKQPTADVVLVVRCAGCRFSSRDGEYCEYHRNPTLQDAFCSAGRKRA